MPRLPSLRRAVRRTLRAAAALLPLLAVSTGPAWAQCQMCKTALTNSAEGQRMVATFNNAILLMVVAPYLVVAAIVAVLTRERIVARGTVLARTVMARLRARSLAAPAPPPR